MHHFLISSKIGEFAGESYSKLAGEGVSGSRGSRAGGVVLYLDERLFLFHLQKVMSVKQKAALACIFVFFIPSLLVSVAGCGVGVGCGGWGQGRVPSFPFHVFFRLLRFSTFLLHISVLWLVFHFFICLYFRTPLLCPVYFLDFAALVFAWGLYILYQNFLCISGLL